MRKYILLCIAIILLIGCKEINRNESDKEINSESEFTLTGNIANCQNCTIKLSYDGINEKKVDSFKIKDESFIFSGKLVEPQLVDITYSPNKTVQVFLANDEISEIEINSELNTYDVLSGKTPLDYLKYLELITPVTNEMERLNSLYVSELEKNNSTVKDSLLSLITDLRVEKQRLVKDYVIANPSSQVGIFAIITTFNARFKPELLEEALTAIDPKLQHQKDWQYLKREVLLPAKATAIGKMPPNFEMENLDGQFINLEDYKGKIVLVDFWASWCVPCRVTNLELSDVYPKYKDLGFEIISISLDTREENWRLASKKDNIHWIDFCDLKGFSNQAAAAYGIKALPASFLIDKEGFVIGKDLSKKDLIEILKTKI